jgi:hypothetical protein
MQQQQIQFPEVVTVRMPAGFMAAISTLARRQYCTTSELFRRTFVTLLDNAGIEIDPTALPPGSRNRSAEAQGETAE